MIKERLPNILTVSRLFSGAALALLGLLQGRSAAGIALIVLMFGWTSDMLDGRLARQYNKEPGFIGTYEIVFDLVMCLGALAYLGMAGIIPMALAEIYIAFSAGILSVVFLWESQEGFSLEGFKIFRNLAWALELPLVFIPPVLLALNSPLWAWLLFVFWMAIMLAWDWKRAMQQKDEIYLTYIEPLKRRFRTKDR